MTTYYRLAGRIEQEGADGEWVPVASDCAEGVIDHLVLALDAYARDGFRFIDVGASATLATAEVELDWSDYGLRGPTP